MYESMGGRMRPGWAGAWLLTVVAAVGVACGQTPLSPAELAALKRQFNEVPVMPAEGLRPMAAAWARVATLTDELHADPAAESRDVVDLYRGLLESGNGFWFWTSSGGGELVYWALDDGRMGPGAAAVGGGHVTELEFSFGLHGDFPGDTLRPGIVVSFYNAAADPVADASDPVVQPPAPAASMMFTFDPITLPDAGFYVFRSGLIDLATAGLGFDLDESFYVEILPLKWSSYPAGSPVFDPDVFAVFTGPETVVYGVNQNHMWSDLWVLDADCAYSPGNGDGFYNHPAEMDACQHPTQRNQSGIILRGLECTSANTLALNTAEPEHLCVQPGETVTVTLTQSCLPELVRGYQAFLAFEPDLLAFIEGSYVLPDPYGLPIIVPIAADGGALDLAAGIDDATGQPPTTTSAECATLLFQAVGEGLTAVVFREHDPPTRLSSACGEELAPYLLDSPLICIDGTPPEITCPAAIHLQCLSDPLPPAAADYDEFVAQGGSAADDGCCGFSVAHVGDAFQEGAGCPEDPHLITRTYRATDGVGNWAECVQMITIADDTPPEIDCPEDIEAYADAGYCHATVDPGWADASDNCDPAPLVEYQRSDRDDWNEGLDEPYPLGTTTITWRATDACGNQAECTQVIEVLALSELRVSVELSPTVSTGLDYPQTLTRCITFELWECPAASPTRAIEAELTFTKPASGAPMIAADQVLLVDCGVYTCITARDRLHTLRRTLEANDGFTTDGPQYVADFVMAGKPLIGGNLNDDGWIDILDFGVFSSQWSHQLGSGDTPCGTPLPHADISGDGLVLTPDFTFIQINYLQVSDPGCCARHALGAADQGGPLAAIAVTELDERGLGHLRAGDLNGDGWLNQADIAAFLLGARPAVPAEEIQKGPQSLERWPARGR